MNRLKLHYFLTDYYSGLIIIFLPLFFRNILLLNEFEIGKLYLFGSLIAVISVLINGYIAQKVQRVQNVLIALISITISLIILSLLLSGVLSLMILMFGLFLIRNILYVIGDEVSISYCNVHKYADFGKIRSFGSLGWGLNFLITGVLFTFSPDSLIILLLAVIIFLLINSIFLPTVVNETETITMKNLKEILNYRNFLLFALISITIWGVLNNINMYVEYAISDIGGSLLLFYVINTVALFFDFLIMNNSTKLLKVLKAKKYFLFVVSIMLIKLLIISLFFNKVTSIITVIFDPLFFGLYIPLIGTFVKAEMPKHLSTVSLSIIPAFQNVTVGIMSVIFGFLYNKYSYSLVFAIMFMIFVIILVISTQLKLTSVDKYYQKEGN